MGAKAPAAKAPAAKAPADKAPAAKAITKATLENYDWDSTFETLGDCIKSHHRQQRRQRQKARKQPNTEVRTAARRKRMIVGPYHVVTYDVAQDNEGLCVEWCGG